MIDQGVVEDVQFKSGEVVQAVNRERSRVRMEYYAGVVPSCITMVPKSNDRSSLC